MHIRSSAWRPFFHVALSFAVGLLVINLGGCSLVGNAGNSRFPGQTNGSAVSQTPLADFSPSDSERLQFETAQRLVAGGHVREATRLFLKVEQTNPDQHFDRQLAPLFAQLQEYDMAIERYRRAITQAPQDTDLRLNLAWTLVEARQFAQAEMELQPILSQQPSHARALNTLAMSYFHQGDAQKAFQSFSKATGPAAARHNIALLFIENGDAENARHWLMEAVQDNPLPQSQELLAALENHIVR